MAHCSATGDTLNRQLGLRHIGRGWAESRNPVGIWNFWGLKRDATAARVPGKRKATARSERVLHDNVPVSDGPHRHRSDNDKLSEARSCIHVIS